MELEGLEVLLYLYHGSTFYLFQTPPGPRILLKMIGTPQQSQSGRGNLVNVKSAMVAVDHVLQVWC